MRRSLIAAMAAAAMAIGAPASAAGPTVRSGIEAWQQGNPAKAVAIWRGLADKGDNDAAFNLGQAYRLGRGVAPDSGAAKKWFERAARAGHLDAQVSLGLLLFDSGDRATALGWLKRAAERGEPRALLVTGTALFNGDGVKRDPILGYAYVRRAAAQGLAPAVATLGDMDKVMPAADRNRALAMVNAKPAAPKPAALPTPIKATQAVPVAASGGWRVQLGAFGNRGAATSLFARLAPKLGGAQGYFIPVGAMTRLQAGPYPTSAAATQACARLKPQPCFAVAAR
ncbi:MAG: SPOR domain-containing protein [Sphingomicrobium sp.]